MTTHYNRTLILLINAPYPRRLKFPGQPTSLLYAAAFIAPWLEAEFGPQSVRLINYNLMEPSDFRHSGDEHFRHVLETCHPLVIGISTTTASLPAARRLAAIAKSVAEPPVVVFGGPHEDDVLVKTAIWDDCVDISVAGDGESALRAIMRAVIYSGQTDPVAILDMIQLQARRAEGTGFFGKAEVTIGGRFSNGAPRIERLEASARTQASLDDIPFSPRHLLDPKERFHYPIFREADGQVKATAQVMTARGCIAKCDFCSESQKLFQRSVTNVVNELRALKDQGYCAIFFDDSTMTNRSKDRRHFLKELGKALLDLGFEWGCQTRVDCVDEDILENMATSGCSYIYFGVESFVDRLLRALGKHYSSRQIEHALRDCHSCKIRVGASLLLGAPDENHRTMETIETAEATFWKVKEYIDNGPISVVSLNLFAYYPDTKSTRRLRELKPEIEDYRNHSVEDLNDEFPFNLLEENPVHCPSGLREIAPNILLSAWQILGTRIVH